MPVLGNSQGIIRIGDWITQEKCKHLELIIVQDCENSEEGSKIRQYIKSLQLSDIKYYEGNFGNPGGARNMGLLNASCGWVTFWDADDLPNVDKFLEFLQLANEANAQVAIGSFSCRSENLGGKVANYEIQESTNILIELTLRPGIWRIALKKSEFETNRFPLSSMGEDQVYISSLSIFDKRVFISNKIIYNYIIGVPGQLTSKIESMSDMKISIKKLDNLVNSLKGNSQKIAKFYIFKQSFTCLKRGSFALKLWSVGKLVTSGLKYPLSFLQLLRILKKGNL